MATNEFIPLISSGVSTSITASKSNESFLAVRSTALRNLDDRNLPVTNPPFSYRTAGRMLDTLKDTRERGVADPSIVRGHIRRSVIDESDPTSKYRLYFMYNPEVIERSFVSYLDQQALDPFNTVFGSKNLVAPPGVLDFTFDMMFDRQIENANGAMPRGALEDFDYFDLVVRGVIPNIGTGDLPDNGVLMVNPRNITVVFSPQLTIQGRPNQAEVVYEKFDHRMTPTRMTIRLSMKAYYIGPAKKDFTFAQSTAAATAQATVPYDDAIKYSVTSENVSYRYFKPPSVQTSGFTNAFTGSTGSTPKYSSATGQAIVDIAAKEIGTTEYGVNMTKYGEAYGANGVAWCMIFVWWVYRQAGYDLYKTAYVGLDQPYGFERWARDNNYVIPVEQILPGDIVCFDFYDPWGDGSDHVEIAAEAYDGSGYLQCIGGNTGSGRPEEGDGVYSKRRSVSQIFTAIQIPEIHKSAEPVLPL